MAGLAALDAIENLAALDRYPLLPAIQAELWREAGDLDRAAACYRAALGLARSSPEHRWLTSRAFPSRIIVGLVEYLIKQYALEPGAWEIQYIEEYFGEFPRRKTADEIITRLRDREALILMAEAPLPDDPSGALVPVSYKIVHEIRSDESVPKLRDLVSRLDGSVNFDGRRILYSGSAARAATGAARGISARSPKSRKCGRWRPASRKSSSR